MASTLLALLSGRTRLYEDRSFFGVYSVRGEEEGNGYHALVSGNTNHGAQVLGSVPPEPIAYYDRTGPIGQLFETLPEEMASRTAVLGLGTGTMACYNKTGQRMDFYGIDPLVEQIARDEQVFTYLRDCPGESQVILGDARLKIAETPDESYGVIVVSTFSSDAIPVHLLTWEAIDLYFSKLQGDGILAMQISNRHLELEPVLGDVAQDAGLVYLSQFDTQTKGISYKLASQWVVMAREEGDLAGLPNDSRWQPCSRGDGSAWTDAYSNLLSAFKWN